MLQTERLVLRPWAPSDATELLPILEVNHAYLAPWIPARVATPVPVPQLEERLTGFATNFVNDVEWRFAIRRLENAQLLGEVGLFPRDASARVPLASADRVEVGYWLRADAMGQGVINEAARAAIAWASAERRISLVELHCDSRNAPSVAVARRLGFTLSRSDDATHAFTWSLSLASHE